MGDEIRRAIAFAVLAVFVFCLAMLVEMILL